MKSLPFPRLATALALVLSLATAPVATASDSTLPDGTEFSMWEQPQNFTKTYYVNNRAANADDTGPGTSDRPFKTIYQAAQVLQPGERVVIAEGVYREMIRPARGGTGPDQMISYEAAPGANVVVKGSKVVTNWVPSEGWNTGIDPDTGEPVQAWALQLTPDLFPDGYNSFQVDNVIGNRYWINYARDNMANYFRRRGMVFVDGKPLEPVESPSYLAAPSTRSMNFFSEVHWTPLFEEFMPYAGKVWIETNGMSLHIRLADDSNPADHTIEIVTQEQIFSPAQRYQSYIRVKGLHFQHAANGFPVPQRGMASTNRGHHFIFEDNTFEWANSVGLDVGNEDWAAARPPTPTGHTIVRGNTFRYCGIEGLGGTGGPTDLLVERNLFEWIGWQDAARMSESAGMKLHNSVNLLFRHNVLRHIRHGNGLWIDIANVNARITGNLFADIPGDVNPHAVHIEGSSELNMIDNNIFSDLTSAILIRDTNNVIIAHNLILDTAEAGIATASGLGGPRPIRGRTLAAKNLEIYGNLFLNSGGADHSPIELMNTDNLLDGNLYGRAARGGGRFGSPTLIRVKFPEPPVWHNLPSAQEDQGWEEHGSQAGVTAELDPDTLELTLTVEGDVPSVPVHRGITADFYGKPISGTRTAGPFADLLTHSGPRKIDPR